MAEQICKGDIIENNKGTSEEVNGLLCEIQSKSTRKLVQSVKSKLKFKGKI